MDSRAKLFCLFLVVIITVALSAIDPKRQLSQYLLNSWTADQGLPQNTINSIVQTDEGYLWVGTQAGLARFNGHEFKNFDHLSVPNWKSDYITSMYKTRDGLLLLGSENDGIFQYQNGLISKWSGSKGLPENLSILAFTKDGQDNIWVLAGGGRIFRQQQDGFIPFSLPTELASEQISAFFIDRENALWVGTNLSLLRYHQGTWQSFYPVPGGVSSRIIAFCQDLLGNIWVGTEGQGLFCYEKDHFLNISTREGLLSNDILSLLCDQDGSVWIGSRGGLSRFYDGKIDNLTSAVGLSGDAITSLYEDVEGSIWVGTGYGLNQLINSSVVVFNSRNGLPCDFIWSVYQDSAHTIWLGTNNFGLIRIRADNFTIIPEPVSLPNLVVRSFFEESPGRMWIGGNGGLYLYENDKLQVFTTREGLISNQIRSIFKDSRGTLWIGTVEGLNYYKDGHFKTFPFAEDVSKPTSIIDFYEDRSGHLWLGSRAGAIEIVDGHYTVHNPSLESGSKNIYCVIEDKYGGYWFSSHSGIYLLKDGHYHHLGKADGLPDEVIYRILDDGQGHFWMSSNRGVFRLPIDQIYEYLDKKIPLKPEKFGLSEGMKSLECNGANQPSGWIDEKGRVFFPNQKGLVMIDPLVEENKSHIPTLKIEALLANGREIELGNALILPAGTSRFEFHYSVLSYVLTQRQQFRYRLLPFDEDWVEVNASRVAHYTNIPPGSYSFFLQAGDDRGGWRSDTAQLDFSLRPFFYQTRFFKLLIVLLLLIMGLALYRSRIHRLKRQQLELQKLVEERTRQLVKINNIVQSINSEIDFDSLLLAIIKEISEIMAVDKAIALVWDEINHVFQFKAPQGWDKTDINGITLTNDEAAIQFSQARKAVAQDTYVVRQDEPRPDNQKLSHLAIPAVMLVIVIKDKQQVEGYLILESMKNADAFSSPIDIELICKLKDPIVLAFRKAKLMMELDQQRAVAERANFLKSQFLANMSHEIRTPMNAILGFTRLLCEDETDIEKHEQLSIINEAGENLINLINNILDFSKIEADRIEIIPITFSLKKLIHHLESLFKLKAKEKDVYFQANISDAVPPFVSGDSFRLNQVVVNVIGNALKFTSKGGVTVNCDYKEGMVEIGIRDTGIGVAKDKLEMIFQPFAQADGSTTRQYGGTGLGLAICQRIVQLMGGRIELQSAEGFGSLFTIHVPMVEAESQDIAELTEIKPNDYSVRDKIIGIIEDDLNDSELLRVILSRQGYKPMSLKSSPDIVVEVVEKGVDVILLDLMMDGLDGFQVNELLKSDVRTTHIPVIAVSGSTFIQQTVNYGILDYICKPVREEELLKRIYVAIKAGSEVRNVFVIDDDMSMQKLYGSYLRRFHYNTFIFSQAKAALEKIESGLTPDIIILDLMMPNMNGFDFLDNLKNKFKLNIPVVIVTAKDLSEEEFSHLREDTLAIFPKSQNNGNDFIDFLNHYFKRREFGGQKMVAQWREKMAEDELKEILDEAIYILPARIKELETAIIAGNQEQVVFFSHDLKGLCGNMGMVELWDLVSKINHEALTFEWNYEKIERWFVELKELLATMPKPKQLPAPALAIKTHAVDSPVDILVAEDEHVNRRLMQTYFNKIKQPCDLAVNGKEALEKLRQKPYDIIFLDIQMPLMGGLEVLAEIRKDKKLADIFVVALTANAIKGDAEKYIAAGCDDYLSKPVALEDIAGKIEKVIARKYK